jgi:hypothetical protein
MSVTNYTRVASYCIVSVVVVVVVVVDHLYICSVAVIIHLLSELLQCRSIHSLIPL